MSTCVIDQFPETLAVVRLGPGSTVPAWAESSSVFAVIATATETSVVCAGRNVPGKARAVKGLNGFQVREVVDGSRTGALADLVSAAGALGIEVHVIDTFDHTWILVPTTAADAAADEWRRRGHTVAPAVPVQH